jgi:hypothetical protein
LLLFPVIPLEATSIGDEGLGLSGMIMGHNSPGILLKAQSPKLQDAYASVLKAQVSEPGAEKKGGEGFPSRW